MALDMAMGGSTNTVLHILAAAQEGEVDFTLDDIDAISRRVPCLAKVAPNSDYHMEDVHRAGGIPAHPGRAGPRRPAERDVHSVHSPSLEQWLSDWDIRAAAPSDEAVRAVPRGARRGAHDAGVLHRATAGPAWTPTPRAAASGTWRTRTRRRAAWRCCAATSPRTAR